MENKKLSPFDCDMCAMIESILKETVKTNCGPENIKLTCCIYGVDPGIIKATKAAIKGRAEKRLVSFDVEAGILSIVLKYDPQQYPDQYRWDLVEPIDIQNINYFQVVKEVKAVLLNDENINKVVDFTGGGILTKPSALNKRTDEINEKMFYEFPTENGTYLKVYDGEYILKDEKQRFYKMDRLEFENNFKK